MKIISKLFVIVLVLILELFVLELGSEMLFGLSHGAMVDTRFRRQERWVAFEEYHDHPSPATKATFDEEMCLMQKHEVWKHYLVLGLLIAANGAGIYYYWNYGNRKSPA